MRGKAGSLRALTKTNEKAETKQNNTSEDIKTSAKYQGRKQAKKVAMEIKNGIEGLDKKQTTQQRKTKKKLKFQPKKSTKRKEA